MATYLITGPGDTRRIVDARLQSQAVAHVAKGILTAKVLTAREAHELGKRGVEFEVAGEEPQPLNDPGTPKLASNDPALGDAKTTGPASEGKAA